MGSIGITVGLIGYFLFFFIELLSDAKYRTVRCCTHLCSGPSMPCWNLWHSPGFVEGTKETLSLRCCNIDYPAFCESLN